MPKGGDDWRFADFGEDDDSAVADDTAEVSAEEVFWRREVPGETADAAVPDCAAEVALETANLAAEAIEGRDAAAGANDGVTEVGSQCGAARARASHPRSPWLPPQTPRRDARTPRSHRNPHLVLEPTGLVEPSWLPYSWPVPTRPDTSDALSQQDSPWSSQIAVKHQKMRQSHWDSRHGVCGSKDNRRLPRLQRTFFDDQPHSRCAGGSAYQAVTNPRARNFDHFCAAPAHDQRRELNRRFQRYPFVEVSKRALAEADLLQLSAFGYRQRAESSSSSGSSRSSGTPPPVQVGGGTRRTAQSQIVTKALALPAEKEEEEHEGRRVGFESEGDPEHGGHRRAIGGALKKKTAQQAQTKMAVFAQGDLPQFHVWANHSFGSLVRLWRCLDEHNHMRMGQGQFLRGLHDLGFSGDAKGIFRDLNRDQTGTLLFFHFAPEEAIAVGEFLLWVRQHHGSLAELSVAADKRHQLSRQQFLQLCKRKGFSNEHALELTFDLLDKDGNGFIVRTELALLDQWDYPEWLTAKADPEAAATCKHKLLESCQGNALLAWRHLNRSGSMRVAWHDFRTACRKLLSQEDCLMLASAWRSIDDDLSGWLSLREFDKETYEQLTGFVSWIDTTHDGMLGAFPKLNANQGSKDAHIFQTEFRKVCKDSGFGDNVLIKIFQGLDVDSTGSVSMNEVRFLQYWKVDTELKEEEAWNKLTRKEKFNSSEGRKGLRKSLKTQKSLKQGKSGTLSGSNNS